MSFRLITAAALAFLASFATATDRALAQAYQLQPGDRIEVSVLEDPSLSKTVLVRPDGRITMPLVGSVEAVGRSPEELADVIRRELAPDFVTPPSVTVSLVGLGAPQAALMESGLVARIYIVGEVNRPGPLDVTLPIDALQALALAGGPGVFAARDRIQIRRRSQNVETILLYDYEKIDKGIIPSDRIPLADGDVIVVPERGLFE